MEFSYRKLSVLIGVLFIALQISGQKSFKKIYKELDPAPDSLSVKERQKVHEKYLSDAVSRRDTNAIVYGYFYIIDDHLTQTDYNAVMHNIVKAENLLKSLDNNLYKGQLNLRKGEMYAHLGNNLSSIKYFELCLAQSLESHDTQSVAIALEQLGAIYGYEENFEKSEEYYKKAINYITQYSDQRTLAIAYANYGIVLSNKGESDKAIEYYKKAIAIYQSIGSKYREMISKSNIAWEYLELNEDAKALDLWLECIVVNEKNAWHDLLIGNYSGLSKVYEKLNNPAKAHHYLKKHQYLEDSLVGKDVNNEIAALELQQLENNADQEIQIKEKQLEFAEKKHSNWLKFITLAGLAIGIGVLLYFLKKSREIYSLKKNKKNLMILTKELEAKNRKLIEEIQNAKESAPIEGSKIESENDELNPYSISILTNEDWLSFKQSFEKSHPKFIQKIRSEYSNLSEAEERLFLLLKLNLSKREIANILGVLPETVKKTRGRLRKRIHLDSKVDLDEFVNEFS